jgi:hypothetical protein
MVEEMMIDVLFIFLVIVFFLACWGMIAGLDKLKE